MDSIIQGFQLFQKGGAVMYLLLACSLFVVYIGAERSIFYQHMDAGKDFANQFYTQMKLHRYDQARQLAAGAEGGLSTIINEIFQGEGGTDVRAYMEMQSGIFVSKLRSRLYYLSVIVTLAPPRHDQRHDPRFQCPQCPVRSGCGHYGRCRRSADRHGFRPLRRRPGPRRPFLFHAAPGPHHYGYGNVLLGPGNDACESGAVVCDCEIPVLLKNRRS